MKKLTLLLGLLLLVAVAPASAQIAVSDGTTINRNVTTLNFPASSVTFGSATGVTLKLSSLGNGSSLTDTSNGTFLFGGAASATPTPQIFTFQNGAGSNIAGANFTLTGSIGTGTGVGGNNLFQVAYPGGSGSSLNTASTVFTLFGVNNQASGTALANALVSFTPTSNGSGTAGADFLLVNATETAKGSGIYNLLDLAVAGTQKFTVDDTGVALTADGSAALPGVAFLSQPGVGMYKAASNIVAFSTAGTGRWEITAGGNLVTVNDAQYTIGSTAANRPASIFLGGPVLTPGSGTGLTVVNSGEVRRQTYKVTVTNAAFSAAAKTADVTLATLTAKSRLVGIVMDVTSTFSGGGETVASMKVGSSAGAADILAASDVFTAAARFGLLDADLGTAMVRSAAIQGGFLPSWTTTTIISARLTTTTNNTSGLTQGSATFYLTVEVMP